MNRSTFLEAYQGQIEGLQLVVLLLKEEVAGFLVSTNSRSAWGNGEGGSYNERKYRILGELGLQLEQSWPPMLGM